MLVPFPNISSDTNAHVYGTPPLVGLRTLQPTAHCLGQPFWMIHMIDLAYYNL